jgi:hypothetical protein
MSLGSPFYYFQEPTYSINFYYSHKLLIDEDEKLQALPKAIADFSYLLLKENEEKEAVIAEVAERIVSTLDESYRYLLLKMLLDFIDLKSKLPNLENRKWLQYVLQHTLNSKRAHAFIASSDSTFNFSDGMKKILLICRLLPPSHQIEVYANLSYLYSATEIMAAIHNQEIPSLNELLKYLFDFSLLPRSYSVESNGSRQDHLRIFTKTMWDNFPLIFNALKHLPGDKIGAFIPHLKNLWRAVITPKFEGETWQQIEYRIRQSDGWISDYCSVVIKKLVDTLYIGVSSRINRNIALFFYVLLGLKNPKIIVYTYLKRVLDGFKDHSKAGKRMQFILIELLVAQPVKVWSYRTLFVARLIQRNISVRGKNLLLAVYKGLVENLGFTRMYCPDIARGLKEEGLPWAVILQKFMKDAKFPISGFVYHAFYRPLKNMLENFKGSEKDQQTVCAVFCKLLLMSKKVTSEDWNLITRLPVASLDIRLLCDLLVEAADLQMDKKCFCELPRILLTSENPRQENILAAICAIEASKDPRTLIMMFISCLKTSKTLNLSRLSLWALFVVMAEKGTTPEIHENLISLFLETRDLYRKELHFYERFDCVAFYRFITLISQANLSTSKSHSENVNKLYAIINKRIQASGLTQSDRFYLSCAYLENFNNIETAKLDDRAYASKAARLLIEHRNSPQKVVASDFVEIFNKLVSDVEILADRENQFICIELIKEFHDEPYFIQDLKDSFIRDALRNHKSLLGYGPRLLLLEAERCFNNNTALDPKIRKYLLSWYTTDDYHAASQYVYREERKEILDGILTVFIDSPLDSALVKFAVASFFKRVESIKSFNFSFSVLTQLAQ